MLSSFHPTKKSLIKSAIVLLDTHPSSEITSEQVLELSGISKGSLYHHFDDFSELMEYALVYMFSRYVDQSIEAFHQLLIVCKSPQDFLSGVKEITRATQSPAMRNMRTVRINAIAQAITNQRMRTLMSAEQGRLTDSFTDLFREAQEKGWGSKQIDPRAAAVLVQSYTIGRVIDDFTPEPIDMDRWFQVVDLVLERILCAQVA
ncbi:MAG: TetR/AcrR family transcriptional regulator [Actinomycetes bacterium]